MLTAPSPGGPATASLESFSPVPDWQAYLRSLRAQYRHAYKMLVLTRQEGWRKAVVRLNRRILECLTLPARIAAPSVGEDVR